MKMEGFQLRRLVLSGRSVADSEITFKPGLNVISGPSDTGKTFIVQCLDYMLGSKNPPKRIPEAHGYEKVTLSLVGGHRESEYLLERSLKGGDFKLKTNGGPITTIGAKHEQANENTISSFLLNLCGLAGKKVRTNSRGTTRTLSFRDLGRLVVVDEETIIRGTSPLFSGQYVNRTVESSVFRLVLTGLDDSGVIEHEELKDAKLRQAGRSDVLEELIAQTEAQINDLDVSGDGTALQARFEQLSIDFERASTDISTQRESATSLEIRRRAAWEQLNKVQSQVNLFIELQKRFELLSNQYKSDLERLDTISQTTWLLSQLHEVRCPMCGALPEHDNIKHKESGPSPTDISDACKAEAEKTRLLLSDLKQTVAINMEKITSLKVDESNWRSEFEDARKQLQEDLKPRLEAAVRKLRESQIQREIYGRALDLRNRLEQMHQMLKDADAPVVRETSTTSKQLLPTAEIEVFSQKAESILREWHFPNLERVTFSDLDQDIIISGVQRSSHGKGVRAITHAAFNIALLRYCKESEKPHPGFVILDSPLVVYREPDTDEGSFSRDVKDAFYRSLASDFRDEQILILENEEPPSDINPVANILKFTGSNRGRYGFLHVSQ